MIRGVSFFSHARQFLVTQLQSTVTAKGCRERLFRATIGPQISDAKKRHLVARNFKTKALKNPLGANSLDVIIESWHIFTM